MEMNSRLWHSSKEEEPAKDTQVIFELKDNNYNSGRYDSYYKCFSANDVSLFVDLNETKRWAYFLEIINELERRN